MISTSETCDVAIIGGGFYGLYLAEYLAKHHGKVVLLERDTQLMRRASYSNQARVHNGYHYPRSVLTAVRSRVNFPRFVQEFHSAVDSSFEKVYAIARRFSKITAGQFYGSMKRIGAPIEPAAKSISSLFDSTYIEAAFLTKEYAFNSTILRQIITERAIQAGVDIRLESNVKGVSSGSSSSVCLSLETPTGQKQLHAGQVFCCTYAQLNSPGHGGGQPLIALKHELTEMALVEVPAPLKEIGITVMDGPFFSLMPFPDRKLHTLSHVRYTPHTHWYDGQGDYQPAYDLFASARKETAFRHMVGDASRYLPMAAKCEYRDSLWEVKTVLPRSEMDDSRPILFRPDFGLANYHLVMGGKIDNVYDITDVIGRKFGWPTGSS